MKQNYIITFKRSVESENTYISRVYAKSESDAIGFFECNEFYYGCIIVSVKKENPFKLGINDYTEF